MSQKTVDQNLLTEILTPSSKLEAIYVLTYLKKYTLRFRTYNLPQSWMNVLVGRIHNSMSSSKQNNEVTFWKFIQIDNKSSKVIKFRRSNKDIENQWMDWYWRAS